MVHRARQGEHSKRHDTGELGKEKRGEERRRRNPKTARSSEDLIERGRRAAESYAIGRVAGGATPKARKIE